VLVAQSRKAIRISVQGPYRVRILPTLQTAKEGTGLTAVLLPVARGFKLGADAWACQGLRIEPAEDRDLYLDNSRFRGVMSIF